MRKIEKIKYKATGSAQIFFDDATSLSLEDTEAYSLGLRKETTVNDLLFEKIQEKAKHHMAMTKAANSLAHQNFSKRGLARRLQEKGIERAYAEQAAAFYEEKGYVDDEKYSRELIDFLHNTKLYGKRKIEQELFQKGVESSSCRDFLNELDDAEILEKRIEKKHRNVDFSDRKETGKLYQALSRAGFDHSLIAHMLREKGQVELED